MSTVVSEALTGGGVPAPKLVLGPHLNGILMTPEEFDAVEECDELYKYQLINGVLIVTPPPLDSRARSQRRARVFAPAPP